MKDGKIRIFAKKAINNFLILYLLSCNSSCKQNNDTKLFS